MRRLIRDLGRQRLRTTLTVVGVALGIFTLLVLGALGEHFRGTVEDAKSYARGLVRIYTKTNAQGVNPGITPEDLAKVRALAGVERVVPGITLYFDGFNLEDDPLSFMAPKPLVEGLPPEAAESVRGLGMELVAGRWLRAGDDRHAMVVDWLAERRGLTLGGTVRIRHQDYEVVGTFRAPDTPVVPVGIAPYETLNRELIEPEVENAERFLKGMAERSGIPAASTLLPEETLKRLAKEFATEQANLFRIYLVVPRDRSPGATQALAEALRGEVPHLAVIDPARIEEQMERAVMIFLVITLIVTVLSTVVGGLLIVNTMAMAVIERRREIAIKAALGATPSQLAGEFVAEAAALALTGALLGLGLGVVVIALSEPYFLSLLETGNQLFRITPRLVLGSLGYALVLGVLAGGIPAARAARVDPAVSLRGL